jgi:hypothetical protein
VLKIPIQGVVAALHRKILQGTGLNEEQMRQASVVDNGHRQLNKILVDLDQDNITAKNYANAFYTVKHIQIPCLGGEHEVTLFHEYRDSVDWVFVDHPSYHRPGNLYGAKVVLLGFQHYPVMLGTPVIIPTAPVPQMGGNNEDKVVVIQTLLFLADLLTVEGAYRNVDNDLFDMFGSEFHQSSHNAGANLVFLVYIILRITPLLMSTQARAALDSQCLMCMPVDAAYELFEKLFKSQGGAILLIQLNIMQGPDSMLFEPWCSSSYDATIGLLIHWDPGRLALDLQRLHAWCYNLSMVCHLSFYTRAGKRKALSIDAVIVFGSQRIFQVVHSVMWIMSILSSSIRCLQFSWDPGGSNVTHRLEGKPHFKKGGMLETAGPIAHDTAQLSDDLCYK